MKRLSLLLVALAFAMFSCKPEIEKPTVVTKSVGEVTETTAKVVGQVAADGGAEVTERGVYYSADGTPTILDYRVKDAEGGLGTFTSNLSDLEPNVTYYVRAYANNSAGISYGECLSFKTSGGGNSGGDDDGEISGHGYVDLGLPSGVKWATCNVGADSPEDYGDYFAWGETSPKVEYTYENSLTYGEQMSDISGNAQYDAATANWGGSWKMPTREQMVELVDHCEWEWTQFNGVDGSKVTGPNGNSIFLPAAGYRYGSSLYYAGELGDYWSSTPYESNSNNAWYLYFDSSVQNVYLNYRDLGRSVRPVTE